MKFSDLKSSFQEFWSEFKRVRSGIFGLVLFGFFIFLMLFEPLLLPFEQANDRWRDITYWEDSPKGVPPVWANWFSSSKKPTSSIIADAQFSEQDLGSVKIKEWLFEYDFQADESPQDVILKGQGSGTPMIVYSLIRPDGQEVTMVQQAFSLGSKNAFRLSADKDAKKTVLDFVSGFEDPQVVRRTDAGRTLPTRFLFAQAKPGIIRSPEALKGLYTIKVTAIMQGANDSLSNLAIVLPGKVSGLLGTDSYKRDVWSGVLSGIKWALLIGILTAVVSVSVGVVYGVVSAYFGGLVDSVMNRIFEIFVSVPLLPVLIVMSAVFKPSIWTLIIMMAAFFWVGPVKTVRSMAMQIREETYIEASRALGAKNSRLIFKHMVPLLVPYSFASMALYIPGAIVYEATVSLLGLGDATIVTWGQILSDALSSGAVMNGLWWWVVPPGLAIAFMGMTFAFIGFAMDKILHPKLRTR
ncbi:MAG TPA: ABC transporter permease [Thermotogota bacterium]|nr:ABC transporter permease [Thermotogota bacterium]HRW92184.1 ABC transporter permease [Thermotogota bacterium]